MYVPASNVRDIMAPKTAFETVRDRVVAFFFRERRYETIENTTFRAMRLPKIVTTIVY